MFFLCSIDLLEMLDQLLPIFRYFKVRMEFFLQLLRISKSKLLGCLFNKEIKWVDNDDLSNHFNFKTERPCLLGENYTRLVIAKRILLPVEKIFLRLHFK